jgi:hypothetical protein
VPCLPQLAPQLFNTSSLKEPRSNLHPTGCKASIGRDADGGGGTKLPVHTQATADATASRRIHRSTVGQPQQAAEESPLERIQRTSSSDKRRKVGTRYAGFKLWTCAAPWWSCMPKGTACMSLWDSWLMASAACSRPAQGRLCNFRFGDLPGIPPGDMTPRLLHVCDRGPAAEPPPRQQRLQTCMCFGEHTG